MLALSFTAAPPAPPLRRAAPATKCAVRPVATSAHATASALSSALAIASGAGSAAALTYEEALGLQTADDGSSAAGAVAGFLQFLSDNPLVAAGAAAVLVVPLLVSALLGGGGSKPWGVSSAKAAYEKLVNDPGTQLLDIREAKDARSVGAPDAKPARKKVTAVAYNGDNKPAFLKKLAARFRDPENTTLLILDKFDGQSELVAELVTANGFKAALAIKDGAEGPKGWINSGLPWSAPKKGLSVDFSGFTDAIAGVVGDDALPALTLGLAAAAGVGALVFTEAETVLQILGSAAIVQFVTRKFLYEEDRKRTVKQIEEVLTTKVAPNEIVDDIKLIGRALLPNFDSVKSLPPPVAAAEAAAEVSTPPPPPEPKPEEATAISTPSSPPEATPAAAAAPTVNSVPVGTELGDEPLPPAKPRPLSPYPYYPNFKPPSSPSPSTP